MSVTKQNYYNMYHGQFTAWRMENWRSEIWKCVTST